jgi:Rrf2 family transcriptional regulator, nitric oxide-sensitive transcriptional repressor
MFSQTVEYALRAMVHLAFAGESGCSTSELAERTQVPRAYLSKVVQGLRDAGLLRSQRGLGGGIYLNRSPAEITVLDVVNAVEPLKRIESCPLGIPSHGKRLCSLHAKIDGAIAVIEATFVNSTLADLVNTKSGYNSPLCHTPEI